MDNATLNFPRFDKMGLEDAKKAFVKWVDTTWDFNKKMDVHKQNAMRSTSVKAIQQHAMLAAGTGLIIKGKMLNKR